MSLSLIAWIKIFGTIFLFVGCFSFENPGQKSELIQHQKEIHHAIADRDKRNSLDDKSFIYEFNPFFGAARVKRNIVKQDNNLSLNDNSFIDQFLPVYSNDQNHESCPTVLESAGASKNFTGNTAHALHSISLRTLRKFYPNVTEDNCVPTVNMNLTSHEAILLYAPERQNPSKQFFETEAMNIIDEVLTHLDQTFDIRNFSPLEKIAHAFHMEETWEMTLREYNEIKANPPSHKTCECALDIEDNGILQSLRSLALGIREPVLARGKLLDFTQPSKLKYAIGLEWDPKLKNIKEHLKLPRKDYPKLQNAKDWEYWKDMLDVSKSHHRDTALFLYCALNVCKKA